MRSYEKSRELFERAQKVLAGGVSSEFRKYNAPHPLFYAKGEGSRIWDVDGNESIDFTLSQGPLILGHSHPRVLKKINCCSQDGQLYAGQHLLELELAETLQRLIPCAERIRFSLSGSEASHAALRLARACTGKQKFLRFEGHYHGWFDNVSFGVSGSTEELGDRESPNAVAWTQGLPERATEEAFVLPWNDLALVEKLVKKHSGELAAIITEPVMCNSGCIPPGPGFLQGLRDLCDRYGILLIFDEVITGFRLGLGGAQAHFCVTPDLAIFGKAMASGYPISVIAGKQAVMQLIADGKVIHAGTMNAGNPSIAAAAATIEVLEEENVHPRLHDLGRKLMSGLQDVAENSGQNLLIQGFGTMFHCGFTGSCRVVDYRGTLGYDKAKYARFVAGMQERGIRLIGRGLWYLSAAHSENDIEIALSAAKDTFKELPN